jgi:hypothetical protein
MSFFNRQLYKQKPQAWGPVSEVQSSIFANAEQIYGIDHKIIGFAMPFWGPGKQMDYANVNQYAPTSNPVFKNNALDFDGVDDYINIGTPNWMGGQTTDNPISITVGVTAGSNLQFTNKSSGNLTNSVQITLSSTAIVWGFWGSDSSNVNFIRQLSPDGGLNAIYNVLTCTYDGSKSVSGLKVFRNSRLLSTEDQILSTYTGMTAEEDYTIQAVWVGHNIHESYADGSLTHFEVYTAELPASTIALLHDNEFGLYHRIPPVFYSLPTGSALPVPVNLAGSPGLNSITWTWQSGAA